MSLNNIKIIYSQSHLGDIYICVSTLKSSKLERLFSLKHGKGDVRALSFKRSKMSNRVCFAVVTLECFSEDFETRQVFSDSHKSGHNVLSFLLYFALLYYPALLFYLCILVAFLLPLIP